MNEAQKEILKIITDKSMSELARIHNTDMKAIFEGLTIQKNEKLKGQFMKLMELGIKANDEAVFNA